MNVMHILFNPHAGAGTGEKETEKLKSVFADAELKFHNILAIDDYAEFFASISPEDKLLVAGGDGTLNRFINVLSNVECKNEIWYYAAGSGNDFLHDLGMQKGAAPFPMEKYIAKLPSVIIKGKKYKFLNGIGFGIDGYCCEEGDKQRALTGKPINYTKIAIMGLLFFYHTTNATVTVDGVTKTYKKVWLASTMNGRFCGGGMMFAPAQNRLSADGDLSVIVGHNLGRLRLLTIFPSVFKGEHIKYTKHFDIIKGKHIKVSFDRPIAAQIDGETISDVSGYEAFAHTFSEEKTEELVNK